MSESKASFRVLCIYGNPKKGGFVHGCVDHIADRLEDSGIETDRLRLNELSVRDCVGCFNCLRTGKCSIDDDMGEIIDRIRRCDGIVAGASVRNGYFPAIFKQFYERITYILGFGRELRGKYVLAVGAVGIAGGKSHLGKLTTFREFHTYVSDYLFFRTGIPGKLKLADVAPKLDRASEKLRRAMELQKPLPWSKRAMERLDIFIMRKLMFQRNPDGVYDHVISRWKAEGLM